MPKFSQLPDRDIASILTYIRQNFGNNADSISKTSVTIVRQRLRLLKRKEMQLQKEAEAKLNAAATLRK
jgi:DNA polymerase III delta prime subunit